jgi:hypothetical protein
MRLESLDLDHKLESRSELDGLADRLRSDGWDVEVAAVGDTTWSRMRESAEHAFVHVLNVVLDETERDAIEAVVVAVMSWAAQRLWFRGRHGAQPTVIIWVDSDIIRELPLPDTMSDQETPVNTELTLRRRCPDGSVRDVEVTINMDPDDVSQALKDDPSLALAQDRDGCDLLLRGSMIITARPTYNEPDNPVIVPEC